MRIENCEAIECVLERGTTVQVEIDFSAGEILIASQAFFRTDSSLPVPKGYCKVKGLSCPEGEECLEIVAKNLFHTGLSLCIKTLRFFRTNQVN